MAAKKFSKKLVEELQALADKSFAEGKITQSEFDCFVANLNARNEKELQETVDTWKANGKI